MSNTFFTEVSKGFRRLAVPFFVKSQTLPFPPTFIALEVADRCCLKCQHCDIWQGKGKPIVMNLKQLEEVLLKLHHWLGNFDLNLTGGEPFLNKNTIDLIKFASGLGIRVHTNSNGFLINEALAQKIATSGLRTLSLSLDSLRPEVHNFTRGNKQALERVTKAIDLVNSFRRPQQLSLTISTIMMEPNLPDWENIVIWAKKHRVDNVYFQPLWQNFAASYNPHWFKKSSLWPHDRKKVVKAIDKLIKLKQEGWPVGNGVRELTNYQSYFNEPLSFGENHRCFVGITNYVIDLAGNVRLCFNFPPVGNVLKEKPKTIWNGEAAKKQRQIVRSCERGCKVLRCNDLPTGGRLLKKVLGSI